MVYQVRYVLSLGKNGGEKHTFHKLLHNIDHIFLIHNRTVVDISYFSDRGKLLNLFELFMHDKKNHLRKLPEIGFDCIISCQNTKYFYFQNEAVKVVDSEKSALCSEVFIDYSHFDRTLRGI